MTLEDTRKKILEDDQFVIDEMNKLRYLYKLKQEIRYAQKRNVEQETESVAEHIFGMHVIASYFLPLEDTLNKWDKEKIFAMITWHDIDEVETGDIVSHWKTEADQELAKQALPTVISKLPETIQASVQQVMNEYEARQSNEAKFVKAIDKAEPLFEVRFEFYRDIMHANGNTLENHWQTKQKYIEDFPYIRRFVEVSTLQLDQKGFFLPSDAKISK